MKQMFRHSTQVAQAAPVARAALLASVAPVARAALLASAAPVARAALLASTVLLASMALMAAAAADPEYKTLREAGIGDSLLVENVVLHRDNGVVTLKSGSIAFTPQVAGRDTMAVFVGEGEFAFDPVLPVEKAHLKIVAGEETVREPFDRALFCFSDDTGKEIRGQTRTPRPDAKLADALRDYRKLLRHSPERPRSMLEAMLTSEAMDNLEADLLADLLNPRQAGFFSAYLHGHKHSDLRFHVKPRGVIPDMAPEEVAVIDLDPGGEQEGIWYLAHLKGEIAGGTASSSEDHRTVEAESYRIETAIARNDHFSASTRLKFKAVAEGDRVVKFGLLPYLRVTRVSADGRDTTFIQEPVREDGSLYAVMPQPMPRGSSHELLIEYAGDKVVRKEGGGNFAVGARESWYPAVNSFRDHALYGMVFKVPKQYTLVGVGKLVKEWTEKDFACSEWNSEVPVPVAGFNYGEFKKAKPIEDEVTHMVVDGFAATEAPDYLKGAEQELAVGSLSPAILLGQGMAKAQVSLRIFSAWFGKSEFGKLSVTEQPQFNFGQSWPTLVYIPMAAFLDGTQRWQLMGGVQTGLTHFVDEVIPHEVSHQWWGHMVGWSSYHDQWLSEGFAEFSAGLYVQLTGKDPNAYLKYWERARDLLVQKNGYGRRPNDAGPLWMGERLDSFRYEGAYNAVVYRKGAYVLHMLRQLMWDSKEGDKYFRETLQDFVSTYMNRNASTEDFERVVEKHMRPSMDMGDHTMSWFFNQWVYGTAVPRYKFDYTVTPAADGKFLLKATLTESEVTPDFIMPVPLYVDYDGQLVRLGTIRMKGNSTNDKLEVKLPKKPKRVLIDAYHDVLEM